MVLPRDQCAAARRCGNTRTDGPTEWTSPTIDEHSDTHIDESPSGQEPSQTTVSTLTTSNTIRTSNQQVDELEANVNFMDGGGGYDDNDIGGGMRVRRCYLHYDLCLTFPMFV
jgi:hypothetical protein